VIARFATIFSLVLGLNCFGQDGTASLNCQRTPNPAHFNDSGQFVLRNSEATFGLKMLRGGLLVHGFEAGAFAILAALPRSISQWDEISGQSISQQYRRTFSAPPRPDTDHWYINYIAHPYQGMLFYNSVRSQNAKVWQSSLYTVGHVLVWEYALEGGLEQPSIQDLIVTPLAGIALGELAHFCSMRMARNGFKWYETATIFIINPMFALNNKVWAHPARKTH